MPHTASQLFDFLDNLDIQHKTFEHEAVFTVEEARATHERVPGLPCKNLFLKDSKGKLWLVVMPAEKRADLKRIGAGTGGAKMSFGNAQLLLEVLGITPGSVTPFALINDMEKRVTVVLDSDMMANELVSYHPLHNEGSTVVRSIDLLKFIEALGYTPITIDCGQG